MSPVKDDLPELPEPFVVRHYTDEEGPILKGNGFDGLRIGDTREEAEKFVNWVNGQLEATRSYARLAVQQAVLVERERLLVRFGDRMQGVGISKSDREYILEGLATG